MECRLQTNEQRLGERGDSRVDVLGARGDEPFPTARGRNLGGGGRGTRTAAAATSGGTRRLRPQSRVGAVPPRKLPAAVQRAPARGRRRRPAGGQRRQGRIDDSRRDGVLLMVLGSGMVGMTAGLLLLLLDVKLSIDQSSYLFFRRADCILYTPRTDAHFLYTALYHRHIEGGVPVVKVDRRIRWHYTTKSMCGLYFAFALVHDSRGIEIVNFTISLALSAGTLMASAGTPYRLVPAHVYPRGGPKKVGPLIHDHNSVKSEPI